MANDAVVHLIDDDEGVRQSLAFLLATAGLSVRVYDSASSFLDAFSTLPAGCIVSDVRMPGMDGLELQRRLKAMGSAMPMIIMTGHADVPLAVQAMKSGAIDFLEKPFNDEALLAAIRAALDLHDQDATRQTELVQISAKMQSLTERERQVLDGLLAGHPNKTIAYDLGLSPRTVEIHRAHLMTKMGATSLSELIRMALIPRNKQNPDETSS